MKTYEQAIKEAEIMKNQAFRDMLRAAPKNENNAEAYAANRRSHDYWLGYIEGMADSEVKDDARNYDIDMIECIPPADGYAEAWRRGYRAGLNWQRDGEC